jgi:hypothetical protein
MKESANSIDVCGATVARVAACVENVILTGRYHVRCIGKDGRLKWEDDIENLVTTVGKNFILDTVHAGSSYSVTGPYMGLISSVDWSAVAAGDTMASHAGWKEAGSGVNYPIYNGNRKTCAFSAANNGSKALSSALAFTIETTGGTVKGCFIVLGTGAVATKADTNGTLYSAGAFTGGDKVVDIGDTINVSYTAGM